MSTDTRPACALRDVIGSIESLYPRRWAVVGDAVGLIVGEPDMSVERVLFAVDPVSAVVDEAIDWGADLLVVHHPLLYHPVSAVAADQPKGRVVHDLIRHGIGLYVAHTNADTPLQGVSESLALALGLRDLRPLAADPRDPLDKVAVFVPRPEVDIMINALTVAGAGALGAYDRCAFVTEGSGTFRPGPGSNPTIGKPGRIEVVDEARVEMVFPRGNRAAVTAALRAAHSYEEPAFDVFELAAWDSDRGHGRIGSLEQPTSLREFSEQVGAALPATSVGARVAGDLSRTIRRVAVTAGAGDFLLDAARASGVDAYVTSDLRHHPASEFLEHTDAPALIDVPHWAAEWTWLPVAETALHQTWRESGIAVESRVSRICTDPWNYRAGVGVQ
ncbi:MAG: Nif3-like dinuclear metal center hexameric protein [Nocardioidaceae bacterium]